MTGVIGSRIIIKPGVEAKVINVREELRAGEPEMAAGKVLEISVALAVIRIQEIFEPKVVVIKEWKISVGVVAKRIAVWKGEVIEVVVKKSLPAEETGVEQDLEYCSIAGRPTETSCSIKKII